ncbi:hypothetical protein D3C77_810300 [compost metagenome]
MPDRLATSTAPRASSVKMVKTHCSRLEWRVPTTFSAVNATTEIAACTADPYVPSGIRRWA